MASWWRSRLAPLAAWIVLILWVASRPKTVFLAPETTSIFGIPRPLLQYIYHTGAFFILGTLFFRAWNPFPGKKNGRTETYSMFGCAVVSVLSELIQFYAPTRSPRITDVVVDLSGSLIGVMLLSYLLRQRSKPWPTKDPS